MSTAAEHSASTPGAASSSGSQPGSESASRPGGEPDWATQLVDTLERGIDAVRSRTTEPILRMVQTVIFGLLGAGLGLTALLLLTIAAVRFVDSYLPGDVWSAHLLIGGIFLLAGWLSFRRSTRPAT